MFYKKRWWLRSKTNDLEISILTDPIPVGLFRITEGLKAGLRGIRKIGGSLRNPSPAYLVSEFRGHPAVTRSIVQGLAKLAVPFTYNPKDLNGLSQAVVVVSGIPALRQMIELKQQGLVRCLLVGPNISADPGAHRGILGSPEIDRYITHAPVCQLVGRFVPTLAPRCVPWAAGVDLGYWRPEINAPRDRVLIYWKQNKGPTAPLEPFRAELERRGFEVSVVEYGSYTAGAYRDMLRKSRLLVGFTRDETQGIAFAEAWACDVPTFIWKNSEPTYLGVAYGGSTAPYLTETTGEFFSNLDEFSKLLSRWEGGDFYFKPRQWCQKNMSDEVCARNLLAIARSV